jgi:tRNA threonylcarbamoyladenosine biosynthesis protein TsaE
VNNSFDGSSLDLELNGEQAMVEFGQRLSSVIDRQKESILIMLSGDLGAGKTTLCRGLLMGLGHKGAVKSPTYTLIEAYELPLGKVLHVDLYRLVDPQELEHMGFADYLEDSQLCLVEWPENGSGYLPIPELMIKIRLSEAGRYVTLASSSFYGKSILENLGA